MPRNNDRSFKRRKVLKMSALAGTGSVIPSVASAGSSLGVEKSTQKSNSTIYLSGLASKVSVENGFLVFDEADSNRYTISKRIPPDFPGSDRDIVEIINNGVSDSLWSVFEDNGYILVDIAQSTEQEIKDTIEALGLGGRDEGDWDGTCGETKRTSNALWFNHEDTEKLQEGLGNVSTITGIFGLVLGAGGFFASTTLGSGALIVGGVFFGALSFLLNDYNGSLTRADEGCGVKIARGDDQSWEVKAQECLCS